MSSSTASGFFAEDTRFLSRSVLTIDGERGTMVIGGQLTEAQRTNAQNLTGKAITGGTSQKVAKGDFMWVPAGAPHWFSSIDGTLTLMSLHLPVPK